MRKVSGTASAAFRAIWGDLEDQAELNVESGVEYKSDIHNDFSEIPDEKKNENGNKTEEKLAANVNPLKQSTEENPTERLLTALKTTINQSKDYNKILTSNAIKNSENVPLTLSPTKIALPIRSRNNYKKTRDPNNKYSDPPGLTRIEVSEKKHLLSFDTRLNKNDKELARIFQNPSELDEILCQASSKIVKNGNLPQEKSADARTHTHTTFELRSQQAKGTRGPGPYECVDEETTENTVPSSHGIALQIAEEDTSENENSSLDYPVRLNSTDSEAKEEIPTESESENQSKIPQSQKTNHTEDATENLAYMDSGIFDSNTLIKIEKKSPIEDVLLNGLNGITSAHRNKNEMCKTISDTIDSSVKDKGNEPIDIFKDEISLIIGGVPLVPHNDTQSSTDEYIQKITNNEIKESGIANTAMDENPIEIRNLDTVDQENQAINSVEIVLSEKTNQLEPLDYTSLNLHNCAKNLNKIQIKEDVTENCLLGQNDNKENFSSNSIEQKLQIAKFSNFTAKEVYSKPTQYSECKPIITEIMTKVCKIQPSENRIQDEQTTDSVANEMVPDIKDNPRYNLIMTDVKTTEHEAHNEMEKDQDLKEADVVVNEIAEETNDDSQCEPITVEVMPQDHEAQHSINGSQDEQTTHVVANDIAEETNDDSQCESIITEVKALTATEEGQDLTETDFVDNDITDETNEDSQCVPITVDVKALTVTEEEQDLTEADSVANEIAEETNDDSQCESIITEVKALTVTEEEQDLTKADSVANEIAEETNDDSQCESIITEVKALTVTEEEQDLTKADSVANEIAEETNDDSQCESIITEVKALSATEEGQDLTETDFVDNDITDETNEDSQCVPITVDVKALTVTEEEQDLTEADSVANEIAEETNDDSQCESIITEVKALTVTEEEQDLTETDVVGNDIIEETNDDSQCEPITVEVMSQDYEAQHSINGSQDEPTTHVGANDITDKTNNDSECMLITTDAKTLDHESSTGIEMDSVLKGTGSLVKVDFHDGFGMNRSPQESSILEEKNEEKNLCETETDDFKRVDNSSFSIKNENGDSAAIFSDQIHQSKTVNVDAVHDNDDVPEKTNNKITVDKQVKIMYTKSDEIKISAKRPGPARETSYIPHPNVGNNNFETHSSRLTQSSIKKKYNASDSGSITTAKVKKSLREKIMGKINGKLHKSKG